MAMNCTCSFNFSPTSTCSSLLLPPINSPAPSSFPGFHPSRLPLPGLKKKAGLTRGFVVCKAFGNDGQEDGNGRGRSGFSTAARDKLFMDEEIGAEYGEGFETFRPEGPLKVDVDFLNDKMQENFLQRIRHVIKPDEAFGLIFSWDNVVADTRSLKIDALNRLANEQGEEIPNVHDVYKSMLYAGADHELHKVLHWVNDEAELESVKERLSQLYHDNLLKLEAPVEGLKDWLHAVYTAGVPCALTSSLDRQTLVGALKRMGLEKYFRAMVTEEDDMESIAHRFLSAAVKLDRRPSRCVVFEDDPRGITAAHNCTMMAVALIGSHRAYELGQADLAVGSFDELSVINLRRLFAHKGPRFMDLQKQDTDIIGPPRRKLTIDTIY